MNIKLKDRVGHQYRYAAALSAIGRPHSHDYAAELYQKALIVSDRAIGIKFAPDGTKNDHSVSDKIVFSERAAASWQLAADMVATQATNQSDFES